MKKTHAGGIPIREYNRIHKWAERHMKKTGTCINCLEVTKTHWSNKTQKYLQDPKDWQELCPQCHRDHDLRKFGHLWKHKPRAKKFKYIPKREEIENSLEYQEALTRLRTYDWFIEDDIDNYSDVSILIHMRDNVYIKRKYWNLWRELKDNGLIPELLESMLQREERKRKDHQKGS